MEQAVKGSLTGLVQKRHLFAVFERAPHECWQFDLFTAVVGPGLGSCFDDCEFEFDLFGQRDGRPVIPGSSAQHHTTAAIDPVDVLFKKCRTRPQRQAKDARRMPAVSISITGSP